MSRAALEQALRELGGSQESAGEPVLRRVPVLVYGPERGGEAVLDGQAERGHCAPGVLAGPPARPDDVFPASGLRAKLADPQRQQLVELHESDKLLAGRKVLIVDDDMRNIFAALDGAGRA